MKRSAIIIIGLLLCGIVCGMTERKNFSGQATPGVLLDIYRGYNLSQVLPDPNVVNDPNEPERVRIFPGDDTLRTFIRCNLRNCEVPPGSTIIKCQTSIGVSNVIIGSITVTVDGESSSIDFYGSKFWRNGWHSADSVPNIPSQDIDTSDSQYIALLAGIDILRAVMTERLRLFSMASDEQRRAWWKNDPLLKSTLLLLQDGAEYRERLEGLDDE